MKTRSEAEVRKEADVFGRTELPERSNDIEKDTAFEVPELLRDDSIESVEIELVADLQKMQPGHDNKVRKDLCLLVL